MLINTRQGGEPESSHSQPAVFHRWLGQSRDLVFPPACCLCGGRLATRSDLARQPLLCSRCVRELTTDQAPRCHRCARPLPGSFGATAQPSRAAPVALAACPACRTDKLQFESAVALGVYDRKLRKAVLKMKQATGEALTVAIGQLLAEHLAGRLATRVDAIAAVPTYWSRRLTRTTNCPDILLEVVSRRLGVRALPGLLRCRRKTKKQGTLLPGERRQNVHRAYAASAGYDIKGANLLVVDDVITTGATANEIARVLRRAGARSVTIGAVARGIGFDD